MIMMTDVSVVTLLTIVIVEDKITLKSCYNDYISLYVYVCMHHHILLSSSSSSCGVVLRRRE